MIRIDCFTRDGCDACKIAIKNITEAINEANCDITLNIRNTNLDDILRKEITKFPTTVIIKVDNDYKRKGTDHISVKLLQYQDKNNKI